MDRLILPLLLIGAFVFACWTVQHSKPGDKGLLQTSLESRKVTTSGIDYFKNSDYALHVALVQHKPVVAMITSPTCPPCHYMLEQVIPSSQIQPYHNKFIWLHIDFESEDAQQFFKQYGGDMHGIPHTPYILYFRPDGTYAGCSYALEPTEFSQKLEEVATLPAGQ